MRRVRYTKLTKRYRFNSILKLIIRKKTHYVDNQQKDNNMYQIEKYIQYRYQSRMERKSIEEKVLFISVEFNLTCSIKYNLKLFGTR